MKCLTMHPVTTTTLQREFGLPFITAERIIREQTALARQPYRRWNVPIMLMLAVCIACTFAPDGSWADHLGHLLLLMGLLASSLILCLTHRRARPAILAAARAAAQAT